MGLAEQIAGATLILEIVREIRDPRLFSRLGSRQKAAIRDTLRRIYFVPTGVKSILEQLAQGRTVNDLSPLSSFNDAEPQISRLVDQLSSDDYFTLVEQVRNKEALTVIFYEKMRLRRDIQSALNEALTFDHHIEPRVARLLLAAVEELNFQIESFDQDLARE